MKDIPWKRHRNWFRFPIGGEYEAQTFRNPITLQVSIELKGKTSVDYWADAMYLCVKKFIFSGADT